MSIRVALHHKTVYHYDRPITIYPQIVRLRPAPHCRTKIEAYSLKIEPAEHFINWQQDPYGNFLARLVFPKPARKLSIEVNVVADMTVVNPFDFFLDDSAKNYPVQYEGWQHTELLPFLQTEPMGPRMQEYINSIDRTETPTIDFLVALNHKVQGDVGYLIRLEPGVQSPEETLEKRSGSCRDSAWLMVQVLRHLGLAARFVSGYLIQLVADIKPLEGPEGPKTDFTDLHAWAEVYLPGAGWVGMDPTSGLLTGEGHVPLAATPDPIGAAPLTGAIESCDGSLDFHMEVTRIEESPRVTKPYTPEQWDSIEKLGHRIDADLEAGAVRLTMGGEPTFVSAEDMEGDEWNTAAVGPTKRLLAGDLIRRLQTRFAPGAFFHFGQGKWYPGEPLPRWALSCFWRRDGVPVWENLELFADERVDYGHGQEEAERFIQHLATRLEVAPELAISAYEDVWYAMWRERRLPTNVDPLKSKLEDEVERATLARIFEKGLGTIVGYALPIRAGRYGEKRWISGAWFLRQEHMFLFPGDSAMGFRLPLDSLPWSAPQDRHEVMELDPFAPRDPLPPRTPRPPQMELAREPHAYAGNGHYARYGQPARHAYEAALHGGNGGGYGGYSGGYGDGGFPPEGQVPTDVPQEYERNQTPVPQRGESAPGIVRTAICVEPRGGRLHVFMPPVDHVEDYLALLAEIEQTALELKMPVVIEGYLPPHDYRLSNLKVTPDPGVIEVNVHPAHSWDELVKITTGVYEDARQSRLGTEKFMLDGKHSGTGGGNHIVMGGPTPAESPFLRRPDLLRSLLTYWNNHPSLSYLFSGTFVGPTSQAPRVDEARHDSLYELAIAFDQIPHGISAPWITDRLFRNLLTDLTGNTHRAEFCIDKLYSPDSASGRLGLVEFRAFEMPPHAKMSLTQQLVLRALVAWFWKDPYRQSVVPWGTTLHDKFMLPHFVGEDFRDVIEDLKRVGYPVEHNWFDAHREFRFPLVGEVTYRGVHMELRSAIEPWMVLGEEAGGGGATRYVDSSLERIEVKVTGMHDARYVVTCNGRRLPLQPTGTQGEYVAGIRYRAWQPPSCLHPTIGVHTPLVLDVIDRWSGRSLGGCTWHVSHPGGRSWERFPVNAYEAEGRRASRFFAHGHSGGARWIPPMELNPEFPHTLDLRRATQSP